jgi:hypothetical protein
MMQSYGSWWGVAERFSAAGLHIGLTLLIFAQPWLALATIVVHSCTNMLAPRASQPWGEFIGRPGRGRRRDLFNPFDKRNSSDELQPAHSLVGNVVDRLAHRRECATGAVESTRVHIQVQNVCPGHRTPDSAPRATDRHAG